MLPQNTLLLQLAALVAQTVTLVNGVTGQLTRNAYITPYLDNINFQQFVPILYFNIVEKSVNISNTLDISFTNNDIFVATDWVILNQVLP